MINLRLSRIKAHAFPLALFENGLVELFRSQVSIAHTAILTNRKSPQGEVEVVCSISFKKLVKQLLRLSGSKGIDFIKINIEGAELKALEGASDVLEQSVIRILIVAARDTIKYHGLRGLKKLIYLFKELGYNVKLRRYNGEIQLVAYKH